LAWERLWQFVERQALLLHTPSLLEQQRIRQRMDQYQDTLMDLADASLVAAAETLALSVAPGSRLSMAKGGASVTKI
jgi:hypothetical protein